jgi:hypothetical protein
VDLKFFCDGSLDPAIETHPLNKRNQKAKERRFAMGIIKRGLIQSARGDPIMVFSKQRQPPHLAITFGSLANAFYLAFSVKPTNPNVLDAKTRGLESVVMLHEDTPPSVIRWCINFFNEFFDGAEASFLDKMKEAGQVQEMWRTWKTEKNVTVSSLGGHDGMICAATLHIGSLTRMFVALGSARCLRTSKPI